MSDHTVAAVERIRELADTIVYEAQGVDDECMTPASQILVKAAQLLERVARDFR